MRSVKEGFKCRFAWSKSRRWSNVQVQNWRLTAEELAADAWDGVYFKVQPSLSEWLGSNGVPSALIHIPSEGAPRVLDDQAMFDRETAFFDKDKKAAWVVCASRAQALLVKRMAELDIGGDRSLPDAERACRKLFDELNSRVEAAKAEFDTLASSRVSGIEGQGRNHRFDAQMARPPQALSRPATRTGVRPAGSARPRYPTARA